MVKKKLPFATSFVIFLNVEYDGRFMSHDKYS